MSATQKYRDDHHNFLTKVSEIEKLMAGPDAVKTQAREIVSQLAKFSGLLKIHLAMEDNSLYPSLLKSADPNVRDIAAKFQKEMGDIKSVFEGYSKQWLSAKALETEPDQFKKETTDLFKALRGRIKKENEELYAAADKVAS
jgi:hemerythrin-like domain-containing protein